MMTIRHRYFSSEAGSGRCPPPPSLSLCFSSSIKDPPIKQDKDSPECRTNKIPLRRAGQLFSLDRPVDGLGCRERSRFRRHAARREADSRHHSPYISFPPFLSFEVVRAGSGRVGSNS
ncbi:hypothetical protein HPP92_020829 [Vanilla planifolia]|uniref:Uncharacterized protein n=1 Tax=Vanilla planifolia TaxID=51239 RepID=A0A835PZV7_VANPL|nr:hypothetical protein HPP92_020829 [Vanilla planifolia]